MRRYSFLLVLLALGGCEGTGPVPKGQVARVVARLEEPRTMAAAEERLGLTSPELTWEPLLKEMGRAASAETKASAIRIISRNAASFGLPSAIVLAATSSDPDVRREAQAAVVAFADPGLASTLREMEARTTDPAIKAELGTTLTSLKGRESAWYRRRLPSAQDPIDRAMAARWLGEIGTAEDVAFLVDAHGKTDDRLIRQEIMFSIAQLGGEEAKAFVRNQLLAADGWTRASAAIASVKTKDPEAIPSLERLIGEDTVGDIRLSAIEALKRIASEESNAALVRACPLGAPDPRVKLACVGVKAIDDAASTN